MVTRDDGTYDLFPDDAPERSRILERWLPEELCVRSDFVVRSMTQFCTNSI